MTSILRLRRLPIIVGATLLASALPAAPAFAAEYSVTNLGSFAGNVSEAFGLNDLGQVVGYSNTSTNSTFPHPHAFLYSNGTLTDLGTFGAGQFLSGDQSHAYGINNAGQIVGSSVVSINNGSFLPTHAFLYSAGSMTDLGTLDATLGAGSTAYAINDQGIITGSSLTGNGQIHGFTSLNGTMTNIGTNTPTSSSEGLAINANGMIAGTAITSPTTPHPFLFQNGGLTDLGGVGSGTATGINDIGQVVGQSGGDAFLYSGGVMTDLGRLTSGTGSKAYDINNNGVIVGSSMHTGFADTAFIYQNGTMTNLNSLIDPSGWTLTEARAINDEGQIVGTGFFDGVERAYLLTPVPEPTTMALLGISAILLFPRRRHSIV